MGTYAFTDKLFDNVYSRLGNSEYEDLIIGVRKYFDVSGMTVDEVLNRLNEIDDANEDREGTINRFIKYTGGRVRLPEQTENDMSEIMYVRFLIYQVRLLKSWLGEAPLDQQPL